MGRHAQCIDYYRCGSCVHFTGYPKWWQRLLHIIVPGSCKMDRNSGIYSPYTLCHNGRWFKEPNERKVQK